MDFNLVDAIFSLEGLETLKEEIPPSRSFAQDGDGRPVRGRKLENSEKTYVYRLTTTVPDHILPGEDRTPATHINKQKIITIKTM